jgi:heterodisulfide reductase subunit A-like polyferredoxin
MISLRKRSTGWTGWRSTRRRASRWRPCTSGDLADVVTRRVVIIGAGLGGLSAAAHLSRRGVEVTVLERNPVCGGKAGRVQMGEYTFDTGPTVLTMPGILRDTFAAADADLDTQV